MEHRIDHRHSLEHFQQSNMIALALLALFLNVPLLLLCLALAVLFGGVQPALSPFRWLYSKLTGLQLGAPEGFDASQFAQILGGSFLLMAALALFAGAQVLAVGLAGTVVALALLNLTTGFCLGCTLYHQLKLQVPQQRKHH